MPLPQQQRKKPDEFEPVPSLSHVARQNAWPSARGAAQPSGGHRSISARHSTGLCDLALNLIEQRHRALKRIENLMTAKRGAADGSIAGCKTRPIWVEGYLGDSNGVRQPCYGDQRVSRQGIR
jgi:hypothetical protein